MDGSFIESLRPDAEVVGLIDGCGGLIRDARLVTVSLSFSHSGAEPDTRHLAWVVLPRIFHPLGRDDPASEGATDSAGAAHAPHIF
jgi:hypothetical protein